MAVVVKTSGIPFWGTTQFRTYFSGDWDVQWGYGILTHGHLGQEPGRAGGFQLFFREVSREN